MIVGGTLLTGELVSFITYVTQILMSLMMLSMVFVMLVLSRASIARITEVLAEEPEITSPEGEALSAVKDGSVEFRGVSFSYLKDPSNCVLSDVNLRIQSGQVVGILGGTGSSKTTLVSLIPRLYDTTAGSVLVGGADVRSYGLETLRDSVAMVLQKNVLFSGTIRENLRWGNAQASDEELKAACIAADADEFVSTLPDGYDTQLGQGGVNLSGGQKQRLCIARALLKKPRILILDDSTSAVDTATDARIRSALRNSLPQTTKIIIAQRIASVQDADVIYVLDNGRINGSGTHEELLRTNSIYREVYESQQSEN
jgi:ATP-binding cassette subfamily B protein